MLSGLSFAICYQIVSTLRDRKELATRKKQQLHGVPYILYALAIPILAEVPGYIESLIR